MSKPYRTNVRDVPLVQGLREEDGWIDMQVQFLIDERAAGTDQLVVRPHGAAARARATSGTGTRTATSSCSC